MQQAEYIMVKEDLDMINEWIRKTNNASHLSRSDREKLNKKLSNANVVDAEICPADVVRIYSKITLRDKILRVNYQYTIVPPSEADHRKGHLSAISPIGAAALGRKMGEDITFETLNKKRYLVILGVSMPVENIQE